MTTAWYSHWPLSHPWMPTLKRKHSESSPDLDSSSSSNSDVDSHVLGPNTSRITPPHASTSDTPRKRRRYDLARNLSQLSLFEQARVQSQTLPDVTLPSASSVQDANISLWSHATPTDVTMDADGDVPVLDIVRPIVEEPSEVIPEIRMHNTSSYEPEKDRIVITDLDSSEDEADTPPHTPGGKDAPYSVSPAFLSRIKASKTTTPLMKPIPLTPESDPSRALVLFTPSPWVAKDSRELEGIYRARDTDRETSLDPVVTEVPDADAMEIE